MNLIQSENKSCLGKVYWRDVREQVAQLDSEFAALVDELDPGDDLPLYKARYRYGDMIVDQGDFYLPCEKGGLHRIDDPSLSAQVREDLGYADHELAAGMVLHNSMEIFMSLNNRDVPYWFYKPGVIFALWANLDTLPYYHPTRIFSISAGARSMFFLPCIGDSVYHNNLERYFNTRFPIAKTLYDQHRLFKSLVNHQHVSSDWHTELLFFSRKWMENIHGNDKSWLPLQKLLFQRGWRKTAYWRNQSFYNMKFSLMQEKRKLRFNPYLIDTAQHLLATIMGCAPTFMPAVDNVAAPVKLLQQIFLEIYHIKDYIPVMMTPNIFSLDANEARPGYYSLHLPTTVELSPRSTKVAVALKDLEELYQIMQVFREELHSVGSNLEGTPVSDAMHKVQLDYFHSKKEQRNCVNLTKDMPEFDPNLLSCLTEYDTSRSFATSAPFVRSCVRLSVRES